jgi:hypothetical protein
MRITLTDGGIETPIIYEFKHAIGDFESFELLQGESEVDAPCYGCECAGRCACAQGSSARATRADHSRGVIGPASDGYAIGEALNADDAFAYHRETWARDELACAREFDLTILGGCCGTDHRSIEPLAKQAVQEA